MVDFETGRASWILQLGPVQDKGSYQRKRVGGDVRGQAEVRVRERQEDATLLDLNMKKGATR